MMNTPKKHQAKLRACDDLLFDEALANIYYVSNPVDCPPCNVKQTYEWFYKEPPADIHQPQEEMTLLPEKEKSNELE